MMKLSLLILPAMLAVQLTVQSAPAPRDTTEQFFGGKKQKVCGRVLIHLITFVCGGSRWKRMAMEDDTEIAVLGSANNELESAQDPEMKLPQSPTGSNFPRAEYAWRKRTQPSEQPDADPSWRDFFDMYKTYEKYISFSQDDSDQLSKDQTKVASPMGAHFPRFNHPKRERETRADNKQKAAQCCKDGCYSHEIRSFC